LTPNTADLVFAAAGHRHDTSYVRLQTASSQSGGFNLTGSGTIKGSFKVIGASTSHSLELFDGNETGTFLKSISSNGSWGGFTNWVEKSNNAAPYYRIIVANTNSTAIKNNASDQSLFSLVGMNTDPEWVRFGSKTNTITNPTLFGGVIGLATLTTAPTLANGYMYYDNTNHQYVGYRNGANKNILMSGDLGATNGLTASGSSVKLGGTVSENTAITIGASGSPYNMTFAMFMPGGYLVNNFKLNKGHLQFYPGTNGGGWAMYIGDYDDNLNSYQYGRSTYGITHRNLNVLSSMGFSSYISGGNGEFAGKSLIGISSVIEGTSADVTYKPDIKALYIKASNTNSNGTIPFAIYSDGGVNYFKDSVGINTNTFLVGEKLRVNGKVVIDALKTGSTAPTITGSTKYVITDQNGLQSFSALNVPLFTPSSSSDTSGNDGDVTRDASGNMYMKTGGQWFKFSGVTF
jgi:hypothetical protein